jgi:acylphosphatase
MSEVIRTVIVRGRVQGVGYRAWVEHEATARGLEGWVRNRRDGSVEALFSGAGETIGEMIALCRRGPPMARVDALDDEPGNEDALKSRYAGEAFSVLPTL